jgi:DNA-binding transcriptional regulator YiaG
MSEFDDREDVILRALRERIEASGDSTRRIARFLSVHGRVVEDWVSGVRRPRRATLERIETFLNAHSSHKLLLNSPLQKQQNFPA